MNGAERRYRIRLAAPDHSRYRTDGFRLGARWQVVAWYLISNAIFDSPWVPFYSPKRAILRAFGAKIGPGVVIKPRVRIKCPWRLQIGEGSWIGEGAWIDNLTNVRIGANVCLSQGAMLVTGSHNHNAPEFNLIVRSIVIHDGAWVCARAVLLPGTKVGRGAVITAGSVASGDLAPMRYFCGNPAVARDRVSKQDG